MKKNKSDEGGERRLLFLGQGDQKKCGPSGRGLAVQLREKRKKFKGRAGCAVEGEL
jgi:hypothetical protein